MPRTGAPATSHVGLTSHDRQTSSVTVTISSAVSVNSLTIGSSDSLSIASGSLTTAAALTDNGTITVAAGCNLSVGGSYIQGAGATLSMPGGGSVDNPTPNLATNSDFESPTAVNNTPGAGQLVVLGLDVCQQRNTPTPARNRS